MSNVPAIDRSSRWKAIRSEIGRAVGALLIALGVAFVVVMLTSKAPFEALEVLLTQIPQRPRTIGIWLDDVAKLTITGLAFSLVFQARQFSMGVQGQVYMGAIASTYVALSPLGATWAGIPLGIAAAMLAGAVWGFIPGIAKAKLGANEIVSSLMLNYIAIEICSYLVRVHIPKPQPGVLESNGFPDSATFPRLFDNDWLNIPRLDIGFLIAIAAVGIVWFALYRTTWGLKLRLVGHNARFAQYSGINATFIMVSAMTVAGALGGLLGSMFVQGQSYGKLLVLFEGNLAFEGILVAIVARSRPLAVPIVALFYGYLRQGAQLMNIRSDVPAEVIGVVTAIIILLVSSSFSVNFIKRLFKRSPAAAPASVAAGSAAK
jgi:ABC-type uncharacterized transport system permease subunit